MFRLRAVVVAQLVERLLPIPEVRGSIQVIGKNLFIYWTFVYFQLCIEKTKIKKKRPGMAHLKKECFVGLPSVPNYHSDWNAPPGPGSLIILQSKNNYSIIQQYKKHSWYDRDLNPWSQDGRSGRVYLTIAPLSFGNCCERLRAWLRLSF